MYVWVCLDMWEVWPRAQWPHRETAWYLQDNPYIEMLKWSDVQDLYFSVTCEFWAHKVLVFFFCFCFCAFFVTKNKHFKWILTRSWKDFYCQILIPFLLVVAKLLFAIKKEMRCFNQVDFIFFSLIMHWLFIISNTGSNILIP